MAGASINRREIARMMRDIQKEFDKHLISVPIQTDTAELPNGAAPSTTVYNGPVIYGNANGAQLAWGNQTVNQTQNQAQQIAPGFEPIAQAVARTLENLPLLGLSKQDQQDAEDAAKEVLEEVTQDAPKPGRIRRALSALKWFLTPVANGVATGAGEGAQEWAKTAIEQLSTSF